MKTLNKIPFSAPLAQWAAKGPLHRRMFITGFQSISPRFRSSQKELLDWLAEAHSVLGNTDRTVMEALFSRYSGPVGHIAYRRHDLTDFTHRAWNKMRLFKPGGSDVTEKTAFFNEAVTVAFEKFYPVHTPPPGAIVHVTCTGYSAPSGAQALVSARGWGRQTQVLHAYHMGCYAAHPALRIAAGQMIFSPSVEVVHTELCGLHLDPTDHDPAQLVIQSLFGDGYIKYQLANDLPEPASLEVLALRDEIIPESTQTMQWTPGPLKFAMTLSKEVPTLLACALPGFIQRLFEEARLEIAPEKSETIFAVHPGGPRIIELSQKLLRLKTRQVAWSRKVLREHGNMSSATLPHIWQKILQDNSISDGTLIVSIGAGPGLTLSGALFRKRTERAL